MIKRTMIVNEETGEIHSTKVQYIAAAFDEDKGYLFWARKSFNKSFQDVPYPKGMTDLEIGRMARLAKSIWSTTNMLGYRGNGGVKPYDVEAIGKILGIEKRQAYRFVEKMIQLGILARVKVETQCGTEEQFYINPIYFFSSNRIPLNLYLIFRKQLDGVLPEWVKQRFRQESAETGRITK